MRSWCLGVLCVILAGAPAFALETRPSLDASPPSAAKARMKPVGRGSPENDKAKLDETERQKRWDDRMRRATRSMCDRC